MHPFLAVILSVLLPVFMGLLALGPVYAGGYFGLVWYYGEEVAVYAWYPDYMLEAYRGLYVYWQTYADRVSFTDFVLPVFGPVMVGIFAGVLCLFYFGRYIKGLFSLD